MNEILEYAQKYVPFYKGNNFKELKDFPVMSKPIFKKEGVRCISEEYPNYESLHTVKTSGSTGTPLAVYLDQRKRQRVVADLLVINDKIDWKLGSHYVFLRNWTAKSKQSKLQRLAKNFLAVDVCTFDDKRKEELYNYLSKRKHSILFGYSSAICDFMNWIKQTGKDAKVLKLKLILCGAEELLENKRKELRELFCCPVFNRYSNEESGLIAMMSDDSDVFSVNTASLRIELLKLDSDEYVQPGEMGRVVITDLFNRAMPLIRYDVGDLAISCDNPDDIKTITKLCGRSADVLCTTDGRLISTTTAAAATETIQGISKWQLVQISKTKFEFRYIGKLTEAEQTELNNRLRGTLGEQSEFEIIEKQNLPLSKSGKFKTIANEICR